MVDQHIIKSHRVCPYLVGERLGQLTVLRFGETRINKRGYVKIFWLCRCDCGNEKMFRSDAIYTYAVQTCGCYRHPPEVQRKIANTKRLNPTRYWLGKKRSPETTAKMRATKIANGKSAGANNPAWNGGISRIGYPHIFNAKLKLKIRQRDGFTCVLCGQTEVQEEVEFGRVLCVNHIDFDKTNCDMSNLNTLCLRCNTRINVNRSMWTKFFQERQMNAA